VSLIAAACAGFLIAVLWMDLIFDSQVLRHGVFRAGTGDLPESVLASISGYYHRATTTSRPMSNLIALVMVTLLAALGFAWLRGDEPVWVLSVSTVLAVVPILLATIRTVPNAVRLGARADPAAGQSRLARAICRDHLLCLACMCAFITVRLTQAV
jgi:hypothetical protein